MEVKSNQHLTSKSSDSTFFVPDEALDYIIRNYLYQKQVSGVPVTLGISHSDVETVLQLFVSWASMKGYVSEGVMTIDGSE